MLFPQYCLPRQCIVLSFEVPGRLCCAVIPVVHAKQNDALSLHVTQMGSGVKAIIVRKHQTEDSNCFFLLRMDGSMDDFSVFKCINRLFPAFGKGRGSMVSINACLCILDTLSSFLVLSQDDSPSRLL